MGDGSYYMCHAAIRVLALQSSRHSDAVHWLDHYRLKPEKLVNQYLLPDHVDSYEEGLQAKVA